MKRSRETDGLRVTVVLLKRGAPRHPEAAAVGATPTSWKARFASRRRAAIGPRSRWRDPAGENLREPVTALKEAMFLVTVARPAGAGSSAQEAAQTERAGSPERAAVLASSRRERAD